jgi:xanthine phosphoribosyltransferase
MLMERLKAEMKRHAIVKNDKIVALDAVLNQMVDPSLIMEIGEAFAARFAGESVSKVVTLEASGIAPAFATALRLGVPLVFARRKKTPVADPDVYSERVPSFSKGQVSDLIIAKRLLSHDDRILVIDDIIANGGALAGLLRIIGQAGAEVAGIGIVVEKTFQSGASLIRDKGYRLESLVRIRSLSGGTIEFEE